MCEDALWLMVAPPRQALNVSNSEEADPVFSCYFKTELVTHLLQRTNGGVDVKIGPS